MRRLVTTSALLALAVVLAPVAGAGRDTPGDGTLTIKDGAGYVQIKAKPGGVIGRFASGKLLVRDPNPGDQFEEVVTGAESKHDVDQFVTVYSGNNVRFRYIGGSFTISMRATGIDLTAVGKGSVTLQGRGTDDSGTYSFNGDPAAPLPAPFQIGFLLGSPTP